MARKVMKLTVMCYHCKDAKTVYLCGKFFGMNKLCDKCGFYSVNKIKEEPADTDKLTVIFDTRGLSNDCPIASGNQQQYCICWSTCHHYIDSYGFNVYCSAREGL